MDLSAYYEEFQFTYNLSIFAVCLAAFVVLFVGVRSLMDKQETVKMKIVNWIFLVIIFASVLTRFFLGPNLAKKDIDQRTILCYEGTFEISETLHGIDDKAVFLFDDQVITLKYYEEEVEYDAVKPGRYEGTLIYAQHLKQVLYLEMQSK